MEIKTKAQKREELADEVSLLRGKIGKEVNRRVSELKKNKNPFSELCFCILTANYTAEGGMRIQKECDFSKMGKEEIRNALKKLGHRFPNMRAEFINEAKGKKNMLYELEKMESSQERREWLAKNVKGIGYKEASHFLRNIGYMDVAIVDRHIVNLLAERGMVKKPKSITKKHYLEIEKELEKICGLAKMPQGELDFYLWYMKTGKILK